MYKIFNFHWQASQLSSTNSCQMDIVTPSQESNMATVNFECVYYFMLRYKLFSSCNLISEYNDRYLCWHIMWSEVHIHIKYFNLIHLPFFIILPLGSTMEVLQVESFNNYYFNKTLMMYHIINSWSIRVFILLWWYCYDEFVFCLSLLCKCKLSTIVISIMEFDLSLL